jgi:hypothetical protein
MSFEKINSWNVQDPRGFHHQHRGAKQRQLPVCRRDAAAGPLRDAVHPLFPHRLLLGLHSQEERLGAGLQVIPFFPRAYFHIPELCWLFNL